MHRASSSTCRRSRRVHAHSYRVHRRSHALLFRPRGMRGRCDGSAASSRALHACGGQKIGNFSNPSARSRGASNTTRGLSRRARHVDATTVGMAGALPTRRDRSPDVADTSRAAMIASGDVAGSSRHRATQVTLHHRSLTCHNCRLTSKMLRSMSDVRASLTGGAPSLYAVIHSRCGLHLLTPAGRELMRAVRSRRMRRWT